MQKIILIIGLSFLTPLITMAQTPKIAFIDWDSIRNQVNLYKINEIEIANFKKFYIEVDTLKVIQFQQQALSYMEAYQRATCVGGVPPSVQKTFDESKVKLEIEKAEIEAFEASMTKAIAEFEKKLNEDTNKLIESKISYYAHLQGFSAVHIVNKSLFSNDNFNEKIIDLINKDDHIKEAHLASIKFLIDKIKFDNHLD